MPNDQHRLRILFAEDDEINRQIVEGMLLSRPDLELTFVGDGRAALERAVSERFDLLILDQQMPHLSGERVIRSLRASRTQNSDTPMLLVTASVDVLTGIGFADAALEKPLGRETLLREIDRLTGLRDRPRARLQ
ncbi:MAG: response regulator [Cereibacter changlensis]|uniref:Response regulatory domain-containing protein n=2 Tax=Cereibacter changlensis TaxID=402884 RepID=A0A2T4JST7_9RHOB|nr:response regulator [Cereibacter changlensis]PTE20982.1 hypothetical protein C5F48_14655 [Cereibacter changlensis JA139]PZX52301.1 response regulator receiver domain-containing protein [Cereibacter changlensis]